jgi:diguanylate cyclase (GGDEF)-like protein
MGAAVLERPDGQPASAAPVADLTDPLKEIRYLKRWLQLGVYGAVYCAAAFCYFFLETRPLNLLIGVGIGTMVSTMSIELGFRRIMTISKRSAYPRLITVHMHGMVAAAAAYRWALDISTRLLDVRAAFLALQHNEDDLAVAASLGLDRWQADRLLRLGILHVRQAMQTGIPPSFRPTLPVATDRTLRRGETLTFVPVMTLEAPLGVLALVSRRDKADLKDLTLLRDMGLAVGLSLDSLLQKEELREMATIDDLTQVHNRRYFFEQLEREMAEARRYNNQLAIVLLDLNGLKAINDGYGHGVGDEALRALALCLARHSRAADIVARLGGDEFALILPRSSYQGAREMVDRLCEAVASQPLLLAGGSAVPMGISWGIAAFPADAQDIELLLRHADADLYETKRAERHIRA